jgi:hypothetical protein
MWKKWQQVAPVSKIEDKREQRGLTRDNVGLIHADG